MFMTFSDNILLMFVMAMHMVFIVEQNKLIFIMTSLFVFWALSVSWHFTSKSLSELITLTKSIAYACQMFYNILRPAQNGPHFTDDIFFKGSFCILIYISLNFVARIIFDK